MTSYSTQHLKCMMPDRCESRPRIQPRFPLFLIACSAETPVKQNEYHGRALDYWLTPNAWEISRHEHVMRSYVGSQEFVGAGPSRNLFSYNYTSTVMSQPARIHAKSAQHSHYRAYACGGRCPLLASVETLPPPLLAVNLYKHQHLLLRRSRGT